MVAPGAGSCQPQQLVNCHVVPGVLVLGVRVTFHELPGVTCSGKIKVTVQPLNAVVPLLVTFTLTWKNVPPVFEGVTVQVCSAKACPRGAINNSADKTSDDHLKFKTRITNPSSRNYP
jgi:hypothetical protein